VAALTRAQIAENLVAKNLFNKKESFQVLVASYLAVNHKIKEV
jgi:hypothetical protein